MNIKELKELIKDLPDDMDITIEDADGNQGYAWVMGEGIAREITYEAGFEDKELRGREGTYIYAPVLEEYEYVKVSKEQEIMDKARYERKLEAWNKLGEKSFMIRLG